MKARDRRLGVFVIKDDNVNTVGRDRGMVTRRNIELTTIAGSDFEGELFGVQRVTNSFNHGLNMAEFIV